MWKLRSLKSHPEVGISFNTSHLVFSWYGIWGLKNDIISWLANIWTPPLVFTYIKNRHFMKDHMSSQGNTWFFDFLMEKKSWSITFTQQNHFTGKSNTYYSKRLLHDDMWNQWHWIAFHCSDFMEKNTTKICYFWDLNRHIMMENMSSSWVWIFRKINSIKRHFHLHKEIHNFSTFW